MTKWAPDVTAFEIVRLWNYAGYGDEGEQIFSLLDVLINQEGDGTMSFPGFHAIFTVRDNGPPSTLHEEK